MTLKFISAIAGNRLSKEGQVKGHYNYNPGDEAEWANDTEARRLIERGIATEVKKPANK